MTSTHKVTMSELLKKSFAAMAKDLNTSVPGYVTAFNTSTQLAQIQIGVQRVDKDGNTFDPAPLIECPVHFPGGPDHFIETAIPVGTEGWISFSQKCIDGWLTNGGIAANPILRYHNINDAAFTPGVRSQPNVITDFQNNGIRIRNKANTVYIWLREDGNVEITAPTIFLNGNVQVSGDVTASDGIFGGISFNAHTHTQGNDSGGNTEQNTGTPV